MKQMALLLIYNKTIANWKNFWLRDWQQLEAIRKVNEPNYKREERERVKENKYVYIYVYISTLSYLSFSLSMSTLLPMKLYLDLFTIKDNFKTLNFYLQVCFCSFTFFILIIPEFCSGLGVILPVVLYSLQSMEPIVCICLKFEYFDEFNRHFKCLL